MKKLLIVLLLIFVAGCAEKYVKGPEEPVTPAEPVEEEIVETVIEEEVIEEEVVEAEQIEEEVISPEEEAKFALRDVLFDFDKYNIRADARETLDSIASFLNKFKMLNIVIEGHCDERGTNEYNLALGERRVKSTKLYLISLGVDPKRMMLITYGEEKLLCTEHEESCWQRNRRAHFALVK